MTNLDSFKKHIKSNLIYLLCIIIISSVAGFSFWQNYNLNQQIKSLGDEKNSLYKEKESYKTDLKTIQASQNTDKTNSTDSTESKLDKILSDEEALKIIQSAKTEPIEGWNPDFVKNTTGKKLEKIADIPDGILAKIGVPPQGFVFSNNVIYWVDEGKDANNSLKIYNGSSINTITIKDLYLKQISPIFKNEFLYLYDCSGFGGGCRIGSSGALLDLKEGSYFNPYTKLSEKESTLLFNFFQSKFPTEKQGDLWTGYKYYIIKEGYIYGKFSGKLVKSDGNSFEVLHGTIAVGEGGSSRISFNSAGNLIYVGGFDQRQFTTYNQSKDGGYTESENICVIKNQFAEQDISTGDVIQFTTTYHAIKDSEDCKNVIPENVYKNPQKYELEFKQINSKFKTNFKESELPFASLT